MAKSPESAGVETTQLVDDSSLAPSATNRQGGRAYFVSTLVAQVSALLRYVVLARILGPEQLGLAATLTVTSAFFDMIADTGSDRFLVQDRDGDAPSVQALVHLVYLSRGFMVAAALAVFAIPIANFYHAPHLAWGLALLGVPAIINGLLHLDIRRVQREHDFRPQAVCILVAEVGALVATGIAALVTHQFTAVIYGLVTRAALTVLMSHLQAKRPYRLGWDAIIAPRLTQFAAPLVVNGLMLFILSQSDRVIVGNQLGLAQLGKYSAIMLLIYYPTVVVSNYIHAIYIPMIASQRDHLAERNAVSDGLAGLTILLGIAMMAGFALVAPTFAPLFFGRRFAEAADLIGLIGILQVTRFMLSWPTTVALAMGRSRTVMLSNMAHFVAIPAAILGLRTLGGLRGLVIGFIGGEMIAMFVALVLLNHGMVRARLSGFGRMGEFIGAGGVVMGWIYALASRQWTTEVVMLAITVVASVWLARREAAAIEAILDIGRRLLPARVSARYVAR